ncbi:MAG: RidA family protein [Candidatus Tantalella remota]|nr:RidA family protein [Candidatus Tantalella remota]
MTQIKRIETYNAPGAIGPYSQAVLAGDLIFVSGQIPLDAATGRIVEGDISEQVNKVIDNVENILVSAGSGLDSVVKVEVFLSDMEDFSRMNEIYAERFSSEVKPARYVVQVARLPKDARVEISCIACRR